MKKNSKNDNQKQNKKKSSNEKKKIDRKNCRKTTKNEFESIIQYYYEGIH